MSLPGAQNRQTIKFYNFICDRCGFKYKSKDARYTWDGLIVCKECWEPKHPQLEIRGIKDDQSVPWSRTDDGVGVLDENFHAVNHDDLEDVYADLVATGTVTELPGGAQMTDSNADFVTAGVGAGDIINDITLDPTRLSRLATTVVSVDSATTLTLTTQIFTTTARKYQIRNPDRNITGSDL